MRLLLLPPLLLAAQDAPDGMARAIVTVQQDGTRGEDGIWKDGRYVQVEQFDVPADHGPRDNLIAFEGPGWESDKVAYRLYLDERNVPDIYGKKLPGPVLHRIGQGKDDYHAMADWGQDILQVNATLGAGGIGVVRDGKVTQLGPSTIRVTVRNSADQGGVVVWNRGFSGKDGAAAELVTTYSIEPGSAVTRVNAEARGAVPDMVAGMIRNPGMETLTGGSRSWRYVASWGKQSLAGDELGLALFYDEGYARLVEGLADNYVIRFCQPHRIHYAFAGTWIQQPGAPRTVAEYRRWLDATVAELEAGGPAIASAPPCRYSAGKRSGE